MKKKLMYSSFVFIILVSGIFTLAFNSAIQMTSIIYTGYYRIFKSGEVIGNIQNFDGIRSEIIERYGSKASGDIYFGDDVKVEYSSYEKPITLSNPKELIDLLDLQIEGLLVETGSGKEFHVTSYRDWQQALGNITQFIQAGEKKRNQSNSIAGDVRVTEDFRYKFDRMPIDLVNNQKEIEKELIFSDTFDIKVDMVQEGDSFDQVAERNDISVEQLLYVNDLSAEDMLVPGTKLNVSSMNYAVDFSYPVIENVVEDIAFEIEYVDDDTKYTDEEEIVQTGVNGTADAKYLSYVVNGEMVPGERLSYEVIEEPIKQIINKGTKKRTTTSATSSGSDAPYANIAGFIWPAQGICISAEFMDPTYGYGNHYGLDIAGSRGESIWAAADGTVESAEFSGAWGNQVLINHHNGLKTRYAHMQSIGVNKGEEIKQGKYIGGMGNTGMSFGVHVHFEVHANGTRVNPRPYLPAGGPRTC